MSPRTPTLSSIFALARIGLGMLAGMGLVTIAAGCTAAPAARRSRAEAEARPLATASPTAAAPRPVTVAFVGDLSLALTVGHNLEALASGATPPPDVEAGYPFTHVKERITAADLAIGNLECVTSPLGLPARDNSALRAPEAAIAAVRDAGFSLVGVANNHARDFGAEAFDDMLRRLDAAGLPHVGSPLASREAQKAWVRTVRGVRVGVLAYYEVDTDRASEDVALARPLVDVLFVFNHWGMENFRAPIGWQRDFAHKLVDAGADAVLGAHSHVLQPEEIYRGKHIEYGLGNFVFSGMNCDEAHRTGGFVELDIDKTGVVARRFYRVRLGDDGAPRFLDHDAIEPKSIDDPPEPPAPPCHM